MKEKVGRKENLKDSPFYNSNKYHKKIYSLVKYKIGSLSVDYGWVLLWTRWEWGK